MTRGTRYFPALVNWSVAENNFSSSHAPCSESLLLPPVVGVGLVVVAAVAVVVLVLVVAVVVCCCAICTANGIMQSWAIEGVPF